MPDEMYLPFAAPSSWYSIRISDDLVIFYLPKQPWLVNLLLQMFFTIVLVPVNSPHKIGAIVICTDACLLLQSIDSNELLIQLACSVMKATERIYNSDINVPIWLNALLEGIQKVVPKQLTLIRRTTSKSVYQHYRKVISPQFPGQMPKPSIHSLQCLKLIQRHRNLID